MERISSNCILLDSGEEVATFKLFCQAPATSQQVIRVPAWGPCSESSALALRTHTR
jgi:hypothetical protein